VTIAVWPIWRRRNRPIQGKAADQSVVPTPCTNPDCSWAWADYGAISVYRYFGSEHKENSLCNKFLPQVRIEVNICRSARVI